MLIFNSSLTPITLEIPVNISLRLFIMREMKNGTLQQPCRRYVMLMTEHQQILLANQYVRCQRILIPISPIHLINNTKSQLNHAIPIKGVNVSEETTVAILMALQIKMAQTMNNCPINLNPDHVTISLSHLHKMIVKLILIIRMNLVGLMPSVILRADALTPTHTRFLKDSERTAQLCQV